MGRVIRVVVVEELALIRQGIQLILETDPAIRVIDEATIGGGALDIIERQRPDVVVIDGVSPVHLQSLKSRAPETRVLFLSQCRDEPFVAAMVRAGVDGYLLKTCASADLVRAVRVLAEGKQPLPLIDRHLRVTARQRREAVELLSEREREILALVAEGHTSKGIARKLQLSPRTVGNHRARIIAKLRVDNCVQATAQAFQLGLIDLAHGASLMAS
ncbi:MAG TPA: response regulator transcription factor [Chloroflexota bacterium]|nr:response regulator transcription factor [Chloroflexota bacterium]